MKPYILLFLLSLCITSCQDFPTTDHLSDHSITQPELFLPGIVSSEHMEFSMTISPDAKTIFFTRRIGDEKQRIYQTQYKNDQWTQPVIASFSTDRDESPRYTPDGKTIYFGSQRPIPNRPNKGNFDMNVWRTDYIDDQWTEPTPLPEIINKVQKEGETWPTANMSDFITIDNKTFYTGTKQPGSKGIDIYKTTLIDNEFTELEKLPLEIFTEEKWEYAPILSPDGNYLFFQVYDRKDGLGGDDIFVSKKDDQGNWMPSVNLGSVINTKMNEAATALTSDGKYFFFTRDKKEDPNQYDGIPSVYFIETAALNLESLF